MMQGRQAALEGSKTFPQIWKGIRHKMQQYENNFIVDFCSLKSEKRFFFFPTLNASIRGVQFKVSVDMPCFRKGGENTVLVLIIREIPKMPH